MSLLGAEVSAGVGGGVGAGVGFGVGGGAVAAGAGHPKYDGGACDCAQLILVIKSDADVLDPTPGLPSTHPLTPL